MVRHGNGQLVLESGAAVCFGTLWCQPVSQQLSELFPSARGQVLHRLGFAFKRPKKRLVKANESKRQAFVAEYAAFWDQSGRTGAKVFFADEAHFRVDEAIWGWAREEATGNLCLGTKAAVQERVGNFLAGLANRKDEVRRRCRTVLQSRAELLLRDSWPDSRRPANAHPTLALV